MGLTLSMPLGCIGLPIRLHRPSILDECAFEPSVLEQMLQLSHKHANHCYSYLHIHMYICIFTKILNTRTMQASGVRLISWCAFVEVRNIRKENTTSMGNMCSNVKVNLQHPLELVRLFVTLHLWFTCSFSPSGL